jgi:hypothetical protein
MSVVPGAFKPHLQDRFFDLTNRVTTSFTPVGHSADSRGLAQCRDPVYGTPSNAGGGPRPMAGVAEEQKLWGVGSSAIFGAVRVSHAALSPGLMAPSTCHAGDISSAPVFGCLFAVLRYCAKRM